MRQREVPNIWEVGLWVQGVELDEGFVKEIMEFVHRASGKGPDRCNRGNSHTKPVSQNRVIGLVPVHKRTRLEHVENAVAEDKRRAQRVHLVNPSKVVEDRDRGILAWKIGLCELRMQHGRRQEDGIAKQRD